MGGVYKETIPSVSLAAAAVRLREQGYDRFRFRFNSGNRKLVDLVAWKYYERPDLRKKSSRLLDLQFRKNLDIENPYGEGMLKPLSSLATVPGMNSPR